jgi:hypothetical protein
MQTLLAEPLDRTQEVGGSNPRSSMNSTSLEYAPIRADFDWLPRRARVTSRRTRSRWRTWISRSSPSEQSENRPTAARPEATSEPALLAGPDYAA